MAQSLEQFAKNLLASGLPFAGEFEAFLQGRPAAAQPADGEQCARMLVKEKKLTAYQAQEVYAGRGKKLVLGNYVIHDKLGQGGMGMVLKAEHKRMGRMVALKVMSAAGMKNPDAVKRFHREAQAAAKLTHPNIVRAFDADEAAGQHFLVMEYVEGLDLSQLVKKNGPLSVEKALHCIRQAAAALEFAHGAGVIHRDIKPANLLLDGEGTVKILDMGLARLEHSAEQGELTGTGQIMGTVDYMAPEQAMSTRSADARADIYSLGMTLWYLLTARVAFEGETLMAKLLAHQGAPVPFLASVNLQVPPVLDRVFQKMVAKTPPERFQSMTEVLAALERVHSGREQTPLAAPLDDEDSKLSAFFHGFGGVSPGPSGIGVVRAAPPARALEHTIAISGALSDTDPDSPQPHPARGAPSAPPKPWHADWRVWAMGGGGLGGILLLVLVAVFLSRGTTKPKVAKGGPKLAEKTMPDVGLPVVGVGRPAETNPKASTLPIPTATVGSDSPSFKQPEEYGYHSELASQQDSTKWVQVDLGKSIPLSRIVLRPCYDDWAKIGAGFGFPVRYRVELSDDPMFAQGVVTIADRTAADVTPPGMKPQRVEAGGKQGRYLRVTATKLALRDKDYIFALAELEALDMAGRNAAAGQPVSALDSVGSNKPRWSPEKLVDGMHAASDESDWPGWSAGTPPLAVAPFDAAQAKRHQAAWAAYLRVPVTTTNSLGMAFSLIPPGEFQMGSTPQEIDEALAWGGMSDAYRSEGPRHRVILTRPIYLAVHEVTQAQFEAFMGRNPAKYTGEDRGVHPVDQMSWNDALDFCALLSEREKRRPAYAQIGGKLKPLGGSGYRLPTEAEWEFACRAGTTTRFSTGDAREQVSTVGWINDNSGDRPHPVGRLPANPFGLCDMYGNMWELVLDGWQPDFYAQFADRPAIDPIGLDDQGRIIRGGYYGPSDSYYWSAARRKVGGNEGYGGTGFRIAIPADAGIIVPQGS